MQGPLVSVVEDFFRYDLPYLADNYQGSEEYSLSKLVKADLPKLSFISLQKASFGEDFSDYNFGASPQ